MLVLFGLLALVLPRSYALLGLPSLSNLFGSKRTFQYEGLIDLGPLGLQDANGMIAAMGDIDGDQVSAVLDTV